MISDVSVLIVNWNVRDLLASCLESLFRQEFSFNMDVWVVDNASTDGSMEMLASRFPQVKKICNPSNLGFAAGNIQAYEQARGRYVLLLNPDTILQPGALSNLYAFLETHPQAAGVGADLRNPDGTRQMGCYPFPTLSRELWRMIHLDRLYAYGVYPVEKWDTVTPRKVDVSQGACLLLRRSAVDAVGFLDPTYYMYTEEVDLCYRLKRAGWGIYWLPTAQVVHFGGQSTHQAARQMFLRLYESKILFFRKNYGNLSAQVYKVILFITASLRIGLSPLAWLLQPARREANRDLLDNYRRLILALPGY